MKLRIRINLSYIIFFLLLTVPSHAQIAKSDSEISFSLSPQFALTKGSLGYSLFYSKPFNEHKISQLDWDRNLFMAGLSVITSYKKLHLDSSFMTAFPKIKSGTMQDSDWLNTNDFSMKTTYSTGDNRALQNYYTTARVFYRFEPSSKFSIDAVFSADYCYDSFSRNRHDTKGWYGQSDQSSDGKNHWWYEEEAKKYPSDPYWSEEKQKYVRMWLDTIDYNQHSLFLWTGMRTGFTTNKFNAGLSIYFSPFVYYSAEDTHHRNTYNTVQHMIAKNYFSAFKTEIDIKYNFSSRISITSNASLIYGNEIKGDFYTDWKLNHYQKCSIYFNEYKINTGLKVSLY